jgi:hypothetical protein
VGQYVIMPDHIHLFCSPGRLPVPSLKQWVEYWKGQIAVRWPVNEEKNGQGEDGGPPSVAATRGRKQGKMDDTEVVPPNVCSVFQH